MGWSNEDSRAVLIFKNNIRASSFHKNSMFELYSHKTSFMVDLTTCVYHPFLFQKSIVANKAESLAQPKGRHWDSNWHTLPKIRSPDCLRNSPLFNLQVNNLLLSHFYMLIKPKLNLRFNERDGFPH